VLGDRAENLTAGSAERLEAGQLGLDGDARLGCRIDQGPAVGQDGRGRRRGGVCGLASRRIGGQRPQRRRIGIEPEYQLGAALGDLRSEPVAQRQRLSVP
jgi:hypothetical protein